MKTHTVGVQMPVALHGREIKIVETTLELPRTYQPQEGQWFYHPIFNGLMPLGPIFFDGFRGWVVITTAGVAYDYTRTLTEWLNAHPVWSETEHPFIEPSSIVLADDTDNEEP